MIHSYLILAAGDNPAKAIINQFGIEWPLLIAQIVSFTVVAFLLYRFGFKPVLVTIEERQNKIAEGVRNAEEMKKRLAETERQHEETLKKASAEAQQLIDEARTTSQELIEKQTAEAAAQSSEILRKGQEAIELDRRKMLAEAREEIARLVVATSSRVLSRELSEEERSRFGTAAAKELTSNN